MSIVVFMVGVVCMGVVQNTYVCERMDGYNPAGMTRDKKYPPGTWAGLCMESKSASMAGCHIFLVGGLAGMVASAVYAARSW